MMMMMTMMTTMMLMVMIMTMIRMMETWCSSTFLPTKCSAPSSMELLIARVCAGRQAAAIKVASKGFFQLPQKWRQKRPPEIKRLERRIIGTFASSLMFAFSPSLTHLPAPIVNATDLSSPSSSSTSPSTFSSTFLSRPPPCSQSPPPPAHHNCQLSV